MFCDGCLSTRLPSLTYHLDQPPPATDVHCGRRHGGVRALARANICDGFELACLGGNICLGTVDRGKHWRLGMVLRSRVCPLLFTTTRTYLPFALMFRLVLCLAPPLACLAEAWRRGDGGSTRRRRRSWPPPKCCLPPLWSFRAAPWNPVWQCDVLVGSPSLPLCFDSFPFSLSHLCLVRLRQISTPRQPRSSSQTCSPRWLIWWVFTRLPWEVATRCLPPA